MKKYPEMGEVRQAGLHIGVEFVKDPKSKKPLDKETVAMRDAGMKNGIIFGLGGVRKNVLKVKPPMIVNQKECDEILDKFGKTVRAVLRA
ncbi:MAG: aminotransferase class III-fold pyridoxal phosphate-dependent enzyme [Lentisphaerae bacterium]|nr:aminotransferase class III-fold pyridoxal phosphate-dependent enzyme [Lentisphaerota bacterium]